MRLLVVGAGGQLAQSLAALDGSRPDLAIAARGRPELDLTRPDTIRAAVAAFAPNVVVNAAAWTAVDAAESHAEEAFAANAGGAGAVATVAAAAGVPMIQVSTDYVFDGTSDSPYSEDDAPAPRTVYGRSKLAGEAEVAAANPDHVIVRTAWLYSATGANFVRTMLRLAGEREAIRVVDDQSGNPTYVPDLAEALVAIARRLVEASRDRSLFGVFHLAAPEATTWCGFAREIMASSARLGGRAARIVPITTAEYPTPAARPRNSRLDCRKIGAAYGLKLPPRAVSLEKCLRLLLKGH